MKILEAKKQEGYTFPFLNWGVFFIGMLIVWLATSSVLAILGAFIASIHFQVRLKSNGC